MRKKEGVTWRELPWEQRHHALFVGYAPAEAPTIVVAVVVEHGGDAAAVAAPVAGRVLARAMGVDPQALAQPLAAEVSLPELSGAGEGGGGE
jgi:penicillin-binding protein 2